MLREKRLQQIMDLLNRNGEVEISNLCRMFGVTDMTIRRDLENLSKEHNILRTYGGAVLGSTESLVELSIDHRMQHSSTAKQKIGKKALEYLRRGQRAFLDSGTTTYCMALFAPNNLQNVVVTNGTNIAQELVSRPHTSVMIIGGELRATTLSTRGAVAEEMLQQFRFDVGFVATNAIGEDGGLYIASASETGFKKNILRTSAETFLLADSTKFGQYSLVSYAHISEVDHLITDDGIAPEFVKQFEEMGVDVIVAT